MTVAIPTCIVGSGYRGQPARDAIAMMRAGDVVDLEREMNPHDPLAVSCHYLGHHVGYIPRKANPPIARALDAGLEVTCTVREPALIAGTRTVPTVIVSWEDGA